MLSARDFAFVGCRLLALYFLFEVIASLPYSLSSLASAFGSSQSGSDMFYQASRWLMLASPVVGLAMVLVLWFGAGWLANEIAEESPGGSSTWSPLILLSVGVALLGLTMLTYALPTMVIYLIYLADGAETTSWYPNLGGLAARCILGAGLILGARRIADTIARVRSL